MRSNKVNIFENGTEESIRVKSELMKKLSAMDIDVPADYDPQADLIVCIGGDGSILQTLNKYDFPETHIVGINTGHLGFFQELQPDEIDFFIDKLNNNEFHIQKHYPVVAHIETATGNEKVKGLNEIVIKGMKSHAVDLEIFIGDSFIEEFTGDGILVATPAGSTAYNYSLGGSIVDPRLELLQMTPIAPINSSAYRSFTSSLLLPPNLSLKVVPRYKKSRGILITADGIEREFAEMKEIDIRFSKRPISIIRFQEYDFWQKVKQKLL